jgi:O-antigen chain-terminating methyltransferase
MRRTLEQLAADRQEKEKAFQHKLQEIKKALPLLRRKRPLFSRKPQLTENLISELAELFDLQASLIDAKDKEWDALGSNHVSLIFKSLEWRVDELAAQGEDVRMLMKKFLPLKERLDRLLAVLEDRKLPEPAEVKEIWAPLEDWRYAGFENRFRGRAEDVKKKLQAYLADLPKTGPVLDLGCGRGEFLELLRENGIDGEGVDINALMVDACRDKGLRCEKGDILETLAARPDASLAGIFSFQVIEHLAPGYLQKLLEVSFRKLAPSGVLILETINPLSVFALVQIYYLDLSHQKPIHPLALKFLLEAAGFGQVEIRYSAPLNQERLEDLLPADDRTAILNRNIDRLNELLFAPTQYAAIARRS